MGPTTKGMCWVVMTLCKSKQGLVRGCVVLHTHPRAWPAYLAGQRAAAAAAPSRKLMLVHVHLSH
jgi:hypothetical protein